ncbi:MAG: hypothetical protein S4CHLAM7_09240 [Chlamydiae bacterium]|nr:hypothetical protein [Chlamydiota bacterium]
MMKIFFITLFSLSMFFTLKAEEPEQPSLFEALEMLIQEASPKEPDSQVTAEKQAEKTHNDDEFQNAGLESEKRASSLLNDIEFQG